MFSSPSVQSLPAPEDAPLDLVPTELIRPRLRRIALAATAIGIVVFLIALIFVSLPIALVIGAVIRAPTALSALLSIRRRTWLTDKVVHSRHPLGQRQVDIAAAVSAELIVRSARVSQVALRVGDGGNVVTVPLALYTSDGGRELDILGLRRLADALAASELAAAASVSSVLVDQLRAEARGAGLGERPLYRAVELARAPGRGPSTTLTDSEVAGLLD